MNTFAHALLAWYDAYGRHDLPWQRDTTPYSIWISEIMLQQTQVAVVIAYFERFMSAFPEVGALARAPRDEVLAHWSGLGYYARARNLHDAARIVAADFGGELPGDLDALVALPGIGRSTAGAILALGFGKHAVILDGNVKRVLARHRAVEGWPGRTAVAKELWALAEVLTPAERVADYTQAIMDLGATVCTRSSPGCGECPVRDDCEARIAGTQSEFPGRKPRGHRRRKKVAVLLVRDGDNRVLLERRPETGIWGGLYSLPELQDATAAESWCFERLGAKVASSQILAPIEHSFTHFDLRMEPLVVDLDEAASGVMDGGEWLWYKPQEEFGVGVAAPIATLLSSLR
ncbi:MAG TPA: A/G-specific adenine glycosylase [Gammaproteobacteria bacterium]